MGKRLLSVVGDAHLFMEGSMAVSAVWIRWLGGRHERADLFNVVVYSMYFMLQVDTVQLALLQVRVSLRK